MGKSYYGTSSFFILRVCLFWFLVIVFNLFYCPFVVNFVYSSIEIV
jgi:hypothetical protein